MERLSQQTLQEAVASSLPQPNSYLARDGERVLTDEHDVPGDLEMGDLGRESQQLHNRQERRMQPVRCCTARCAVPGSPAAPKRCRPFAKPFANPQLLLGVKIWQGTQQLGTQELKTDLPLAESFDVFHGAALPGSHSDAGTDLFSHHRILHANHLGGTEGRENPADTPVLPPPLGRACVLAHEPSPHHGMPEQGLGSCTLGNLGC